MSNGTVSAQGKRLIGYFPSWSIHAQNYHVADIPAAQLTHVIYAFANVTATGDCVSVNQEDDKLNIAQLHELKLKRPALQMLISVGGASNFTNFPAAVANPTIMVHFAQSCVQFMKQNGFDGIDIDWEYPAAAQAQSFTALLTELRRQLDALGATDKRPYLLTIAAPAGSTNYSNLQLGLIHPFVDWINLMAYDFTVASSQVTDLVAPLRPYDPAVAKHAASNVEAAVKAYINAGVPAGKLVVGTRFVGTGWQGVAATNNGLYQANHGPAKGTWDAAGAAVTGSFGYQDLETNYIGKYARNWHADAQVPWLYGAQTGIMISYEDPQSLAVKARTVVSGGLAGVMIWQLAADDAKHSLVNALAAGLGTATDTRIYVVTGRVSSPDSAAVSGLQVQLVDKVVGADVPLAAAATDASGQYRVSVAISDTTLRQRQKTQPDLQVRVSAASTFLAASAVRYNASVAEVLDVVLPAGLLALPSEHETLAASLAGHYAGTLATLQETAQQQDITYLANKSGWDARAVALAALAEQFSQITPPAPTTPTASAATGLKPEFYYALFRAGFPANADGLFQASPNAVQSAWGLAIKQGVIPQALAGELAGAVQTFQTLSAAHTLDAAPALGPSNLRQMLQAGLPGITPAQQTTFSQLQVQYRNDPATLWTEVGKSLGATAANQLQLSGQLFYLTLNNAPVVTALLAAEHQSPPSSALDLATRGYYQPARWLPLIGNSIPPLIAGTGDQQRANYAQLLATQVRLSFPTAVVADRVKGGSFALSNSGVTPDAVASFLIANHGKFEIGIEPIEAYLGRAGLAGTTPRPLVGEIKRLQRVHQMTRDDDTMAALLKHNLDSAHAIMRWDPAGFVRAFQHRLGGPETALALHARAKQIHGATLNIVVSYLGARRAPSLGGGQIIRTGPTPQNPTYPIVAFPTLENLFGSLDYCDCQECRAILSPAAYLVDLLHYLDRPSPSPGFQNPQSVLLQRRPDLQYLPLTCQNTNTALPYIDVANETLEYFVANNLSLANFQGYDTGDVVTSAELMASPQNVNGAAYSAMQNAFFPPPLPFNRPLELLRLHLGKIGVALPDIMAALRGGDAVERPTPAGYGWRDILMEQLGISREEYRLFTDGTLKLQGLYGYPKLSDADVLKTLTTMSLQDFSRRTGVCYDDLFAIVKTQFINPHANLIPRLERLAVPFTTLQKLKNNQMTAAALEALLPAGLDPRPYGGSDPSAVVNWVIASYPQLTAIITITNPNPTSSVDQCSGSALQLRYANLDKLSATDFVKLIRFIRLWRKLGLSIEQTDDLLAALYPAADMPTGTNDAANLALLDAGFRVFLPRAGVLLQVMERLNLTANASLTKLLACWAPIGTVGDNALYRKMFLTPTLLQDSDAQTATVIGPVDPGDVLITTINTVPISYTVQAADTVATIAANIAKAINATTAADPSTGLPLNSRMFASSQGAVITIRAGFTLACTRSAGATETYAAAAQSPPMQTATVAGAITAGDVLTTTINSVAIPYTVVAGDTAATIAAAIATAISNTATPDPYSGLPLNRLVLASSASGTVTINAVNSGAPFSLACARSPGAAYLVTAAAAPKHTATISGVVHTGDILVTTINGAALSYSAGAGDTDAASLAGSIATMINASTVTDPVTNTLPLNSVVSASSSGGVITLAAQAPTTSFTLACHVSAGGETYAAAGPFPASQTLDVSGPMAAGRVLITTINGIAIPYTVVSGDGPSSVAANIASAINAKTTPDPSTGLPLNALVSAAAGTATTSGGIVSRPIVVTAVDPATTFTLAVSIQTAAYAVGQEPPTFADDGSGAFLQDTSQTLFGHEAALCAACNLTGAEFVLIAQALGFDANTTLTLANVSAMYRLGWLAHTLGLSVAEFLALRTVTGLDPFAPLDPGATSPVEPPVIRFIRLQQALAAAGLRPVQALYLMWNDDISGRSAPPVGSITGLARTLRADFAAVEAQFSLVADPDGSIAKQLMGLVYGSQATDFFFGLINNALTTALAYSHPQPTLAQPIIDASTGRLSYDDLRKQLIFSGVLDAATVTKINQAIAGNGNLPTPATIAALAAANHKAVDPFFAIYGELLPLYTAYVASNDPPQTKRNTLLASFLPTLRQKRKQEQALASVTAAAGTDPSFATSLLQDPAIVHAAAQAALAAVTDLTAVEAQGLSAQFFLTNNPAATPDLTVDSVPLLSYAQAGAGGQLPPGTGGSAIAGIWSGYVDVPQDGVYTFSVTTDAGSVSLKVGDVAVVQAGNVWSGQIPLTAGTLTPIVLTVASLHSSLALSWQSPGLGSQIVPGQYLYSATLVDRLRTTYVRFLKTASLASALSLTANEGAWLARQALSGIGSGWLNALAVSGAPDATTAAALGDVLAALLAFARIKQALSPADERLVAVLQGPTQMAVTTLTGWALGSLNALLARFFGNTQLANLSSVENFRRVYDAYALVRTCRVSAAVLIGATTNAPSATTVSALQSALRGLYAERDWLTALRPISDAMRIRQRDALVAYVLQQLGDNPASADINTPDRLFEYFLIDVETQPAVDTSRIRLALSSIQLFIERILRNLEPQVWPSDIDGSLWPWMKRYRVWQANREVFLWPENWLYPELRDDPSPFFQQTMSALLQSDITDDAAANAYLDYLTSLEAVAKLEPCGIYYVGATSDADEIAYVVARTAGAHRKYYFRTLRSGSWTAWTEVKIECEDMPITPVVWNGRLFLFWLKVLKQAAPQTSGQGFTPSSGTVSGWSLDDAQKYAKTGAQAQTQNSVVVQAVLCWSELYNGKWQPTKTSDVNRPTTIADAGTDAANSFDKNRNLWRIEPQASGTALALKIYSAIDGVPPATRRFHPTPTRSGFYLFNTHSLPIAFEDIAVRFQPPRQYQWPDAVAAYSGGGSGSLSIDYKSRNGLTSTWDTVFRNNILTAGVGTRYLGPQLSAGWDAPFFFEDRRNAFYVTTGETWVPIQEYRFFGIVATAPHLQGVVVDIPPLVTQPAPKLPDRGDPVLTIGAGGDPAVLQGFIDVSPTIRTALGSAMSVSYQGRLIGASSSADIQAQLAGADGSAPL
jgi:GH18 family chitinase